MNASELPPIAVREFVVDPPVVVGTGDVEVRWNVEGAARAELRCEGRKPLPLPARVGRTTLTGVSSDLRVRLLLWHAADDDETASYEVAATVHRWSRVGLGMLLFSVCTAIIGLWYCSEYIFHGTAVIDRTTWLKGGIGATRLLALVSTILGAPVVIALIRMRADDVIGIAASTLLHRRWRWMLLSSVLLLGVPGYAIWITSETDEIWFRSSLSRPAYFWACSKDGAREKLRLEVPTGLTSARVYTDKRVLACHEPERIHWHGEPELPATDTIELACGVEVLRPRAELDTSAELQSFVRWSGGATSSIDGGRARLAVPDCATFPSRATLVERRTSGGRAQGRLLWSFDVPSVDHVELSWASATLEFPAGISGYVVLGRPGGWEASARCDAGERCNVVVPGAVKPASCAASLAFEEDVAIPATAAEPAADRSPIEICVSPVPPVDGEEPTVACAPDGAWSLKFRREHVDATALALQRLRVCAPDPTNPPELTITQGTTLLGGKLPADGVVPWPLHEIVGELHVTIGGVTENHKAKEEEGGWLVVLPPPRYDALRVEVEIDGRPQLSLRGATLQREDTRDRCSNGRIEQQVRGASLVLLELPRWMTEGTANRWTLARPGQAPAYCRIDVRDRALHCSVRRKAGDR